MATATGSRTRDRSSRARPRFLWSRHGMQHTLRHHARRALEGSHHWTMGDSDETAGDPLVEDDEPPRLALGKPFRPAGAA